MLGFLCSQDLWALECTTLCCSSCEYKLAASRNTWTAVQSPSHSVSITLRVNSNSSQGRCRLNFLLEAILFAYVESGGKGEGPNSAHNFHTSHGTTEIPLWGFGFVNCQVNTCSLEQEQFSLLSFGQRGKEPLRNGYQNTKICPGELVSRWATPNYLHCAEVGSLCGLSAYTLATFSFPGRHCGEWRMKKLLL